MTPPPGSPAPVSVSFDAATVRRQRRLGIVLAGWGSLLALRAVSRLSGPAWRRAEVWTGVRVALAVVVLVLGGTFLGLAVFTARRLDAPPAYWQRLQDRYRGGVRLGLALTGGGLLVLAVLAYAGGLRFACGLCLGAGAPLALVAVLMATRAVPPGRYE